MKNTQNATHAPSRTSANEYEPGCALTRSLGMKISEALAKVTTTSAVFM